MKNQFLTLTIISLLFLTGCKEKTVKTDDSTISSEIINDTSPSNTNTEVAEAEFKLINNTIIDGLNKTIATRKITSEEEIMHLYSPRATDSEGNYKYAITQLSGSGKTIVQLVEENITDDSLEGKKVIMRIIKDDSGKLTVDEIKESYRCRLNRGHQDWSAALCQ